MFAHLGGCLWCEGEGLSHCGSGPFNVEELFEQQFTVLLQLYKFFELRRALLTNKWKMISPLDFFTKKPWNIQKILQHSLQYRQLEFCSFKVVADKEAKCFISKLQCRLIKLCRALGVSVFPEFKKSEFFLILTRVHKSTSPIVRNPISDPCKFTLTNHFESGR